MTLDQIPAATLSFIYILFGTLQISVDQGMDLTIKAAGLMLTILGVIHLFFVIKKTRLEIEDLEEDK